MNRKALVASAEVDNPLFSADHAETFSNPRKIQASVNVRESAIVTLAVRGFLSHHQLRAASRFRQSWEIMHGRHGGGIHEHMDAASGERRKPSISERQVSAGEDLRSCRVLLGERSYRLVCQVCGDGRALADLFPVKRDRLTAADNLRACLDDIATMWGFL